MTEKIDFTKDSEYIRMFEDHTDAMKQQSECFNAIVEGMKNLGWDEKEEKRPPPMPPKSPFED